MTAFTMGIAGIAYLFLLAFLYKVDERKTLNHSEDVQPFQTQHIAMPAPASILASDPHMSWQMQARNLLTHEEGVSLVAYPDGKGYAICYGHHANVREHDTATLEECVRDFNVDFNLAETNARANIPDFDSHPDPAKVGIVDLAFLVGGEGLEKFKDTVNSINNRDYTGAARAVKDSRAEHEVPHRIDTIAMLFMEAAR